MRLRWFHFIPALFVVSTTMSLSVARAQDGNACKSDSNAEITAIENCGPQLGVYGLEARALNAEMTANPAPNLTPIPINEKELYQKSFRKVTKATNIYDGPGGNVIGHMDAGFEYVNAGTEQNGFVHITPSQWLPKETLGPVNNVVSKFSGVLLPDGLPDRPFGWMVVDTKPSRSPGALPPPGTQFIRQYTLLNFFAVETVDGWDWYLIGPNQWVKQTRIARLQPAKRPDGVSGKWFAVDLYEQTLIAYDDDKPVFATLISSGLPKFPTDEGLFKIWDRYKQAKMSGASGQPDFYYLPQVPWIMYFNQDGQALHGAYWHDAFGYRHSHGCVNMTITDAEWSFNWTQDQLDAWVYVYHSGDYKDGPAR